MTDYLPAHESLQGLCPKSPMMHASAAVLVGTPSLSHVSPPDGSGPTRPSRGLRQGISIATGSLRVLARDRHLLWFPYLAGLVILFLLIVEGWRATHIGSASPFLIGIPLDSPFLVNSGLVINMQVFLFETVVLSGLTLVLAGLVLHRAGTTGDERGTIRDSFSRINGHTGSLLALSIIMAILATGMDVVVSQTRFFGGIVSGIFMTVFYLPYAYYFPDELFSTLFFSTEIMFINSLLLLVALAVVPCIVLEKSGLVTAIAGAVTRVKAGWRELLGCLIVMGLIIAGIAAVALLIGQSPLLLNHDYDFFLQMSRGQVFMTAICYGFIAVCWVLLAVGYTAAGICVVDLFRELIPKRSGSAEIPAAPAPTESGLPHEKNLF